MKEETKANKKYLNRYRRHMRRVEKLEEKLYLIDCDLQGMKTKNITDMPQGGQRLTMDDLLVKKEETEHRIQNILDICKNIKLEVYDCIDTLEDERFAEILEAYFIDCFTFEEIAEKKNYSVRHVGYLYGMGLESVQIPKNNLREQ